MTGGHADRPLCYPLHYQYILRDSINRPGAPPFTLCGTFLPYFAGTYRALEGDGGANLALTDPSKTALAFIAGG
jgi:hypothetical protein